MILKPQSREQEMLNTYFVYEEPVYKKPSASTSKKFKMFLELQNVLSSWNKKLSLDKF